MKLQYIAIGRDKFSNIKHPSSSYTSSSPLYNQVTGLKSQNLLYFYIFSYLRPCYSISHVNVGMLNQNNFFASESILILFEVWLLSPTTILHNFYKGIIMQSNWYEILCIPIKNCNIVVLEKIFIVFCRYLFCGLLNLQNYRMTLTVYSYTSI